MTLANKVTSIRLILAPIFFAVYFLPRLFDFLDISAVAVENLLRLIYIIVLWTLFIASEVTDLLDGIIARSRNEVSEFGKLFDPFADTLVRITYFLCFVLDGVLPAVLFLAILYRELSIQFLRNLMIRKGLVQGARKGGKIKAFTYMLTGVAALLAASVQKLNLDDGLFSILHVIAVVLFAVSVLFAVVSFLDYLSVYKKQNGTRDYNA
ncbi:MAG: CDP-diacylglycerol--glycerol-3-phosphate 3-phosphatidyltransferase [Treponema sp.]|jgi:CDP-diacylglycerol--glycerol-3-phosphate 3-phosphatidyltransferase|nr:CDP-diacylglycerol--glycerol-3-phosphate 3-phosphatidyltransferase [Treponema sp.]